MFWLRIVAIAQLALTAKRHLEMLEADERRRLAGLVKQSRGLPTRYLSANEREEMLRLVRKLEPVRFGRAAAGAVAKGRKPKL